jgi:small-conductance mechanosensitive channel
MLESATDSTTKAVVAIVNFFTSNWDKLLYSFIIVVIAFVLIKVLRAINTQFGKERALSAGTISFVNGIIKYGILFFAAINILGVYSFTYVYSLILSLGLISVVIALGSQTIISNLMGGVIVYLERPFKVGDIIKIGDNIGEVLAISFRTTTLRGLNGLDITIPNATFLIMAIVNYTRTQSYLLKVPFIMPRTADISQLLDTVRQRVGSLPGIRTDKDMHIYKASITPDNISYEFHVWVKDPRDSERATSAVIDVVNGFYPGTGKQVATT